MIDILFAGDFNPPSDGELSYSEDLLSALKAKDFSIVNLETTLTRSNQSISKIGKTFKKDPRLIGTIKNGYFDAVSLANNHIRDYGDDGVNETQQTCWKEGIYTLGAGMNAKAARKPLVVNLKGVKIGFLNYCEDEFNGSWTNRAGGNVFDVTECYHDIRTLKPTVDHLFVIYHGGIEHHPVPAINVRKYVRFMIDCGADGVIVHHSHCYSGYELYKKKPIAWGLGNFISETKVKNQKREWFIGILAKITIADSKYSLSVIPIQQNFQFNHVSLLGEEESVQILRKVTDIVEIINNDEAFFAYWDKQFKQRKAKIIGFLNYRHFLYYTLLRKVGLINSSLPDWKRKRLLNLIRCDSHREALISCLDRK